MEQRTEMASESTGDSVAKSFESSSSAVETTTVHGIDLQVATKKAACSSDNGMICIGSIEILRSRQHTAQQTILRATTMLEKTPIIILRHVRLGYNSLR